MSKDWYTDLPPGTEEIWDIVAKALLLRADGMVMIPERELREAARTECEIQLTDDGTIWFRVKQQ